MAYIGSFASGFMQSFLAARSMRMQQDYYKQMQAYYQYLMRSNNYDPQSGKFWDPGTGKFSSPVYVGSEDKLVGAAKELMKGYDQRQQGAWWTPDRMQHISDRLQKEAGLSPVGAAGLVARWSSVEAGAGPSAVNPKSGAAGLNQALGDRQPKGYASWDADKQLDYIIKTDLLAPDQKQALDVLRNAKTPDEASRGASMYERAEGYNAQTGTDNFTGATPVQRVMDAITTGTGTGKVTTGGTAKTSTGAPVKTDDQGRAIDPATGKPTQSGTPQASALPGGSVANPIQVASTDPNAGFQALARQQAIPTQQPSRPVTPTPATTYPIVPGQPARPVTPTPTTPAPVTPQSNAPPTQGEYQPATGNARVAQWVPNRSPNPPIGGPLAKPVPTAAPVPANAPLPPPRPAIPPVTQTQAPVQNKPVLPPPLKPPTAPPIPGAGQQGTAST